MIGTKIKIDEDYVYHLENEEITIHPGMFTVIGNYSGYWILGAWDSISGKPETITVVERRMNTLINLIKNKKHKGYIEESEMTDYQIEIEELKDRLDRYRTIRDKIIKENQELRDSLTEKTKALSLSVSTIQNQAKSSSAEYTKYTDIIKKMADLL